MVALLKDNSFENKVWEWVNLAGLADISFAVLFIAFGLTKFVDLFGLAQSNYTMCVLLFNLAVAMLVRKYIIQPRYGYMQKKGFFSPKIGLLRIVLSFGILLLLMTIMKFCLKYFTGTNIHDLMNYSRLGSLIGLGIALIIALPFATKPIKIRAAIYFPVLVAGLVTAVLLSSSIGEVQAYIVGLAIPGIIILGIGVYILYRFLKEYPSDQIVEL